MRARNVWQGLVFRHIFNDIGQNKNVVQVRPGGGLRGGKAFPDPSGEIEFNFGSNMSSLI